MSSAPIQSTPEIEAAVQKIRKLMTYANDGSASEGEIENAMGHARKLMQKFNLEEKEILLSEDKSTQESLYDSIHAKESYQRAGSIDHFDKLMAVVASNICDCSAYFKTSWIKNARGNYGNGEVLVFYGLPRDVAIAQALYKELLTTMRSMVKFRFKENWQKRYNGYCYGFSERLVQRSIDLKNKPTHEAETSTAIVLRKDDLLRTWASKNLTLGPGKARTAKVNGDDYSAGHSDANHVELGTNGIK